MNWININEKLPSQFEEVIIATNTGNVKSAKYLGDGKFTTYLTVTHWMPMPEAPSKDVDDDTVVEPIKKRRGRPKKV